MTEGYHKSGYTSYGNISTCPGLPHRHMHYDILATNLLIKIASNIYWVGDNNKRKGKTNFMMVGIHTQDIFRATILNQHGSLFTAHALAFFLFWLVKKKSSMIDGNAIPPGQVVTWQIPGREGGWKIKLYVCINSRLRLLFMKDGLRFTLRTTLCHKHLFSQLRELSRASTRGGMWVGLDYIGLGDIVLPFRKWNSTQPLGHAVILRPGHTIAPRGGGKIHEVSEV